MNNQGQERVLTSSRRACRAIVISGICRNLSARFLRVSIFTLCMLTVFILGSTSYTAWAAPEIMGIEPPTSEPEGLVDLTGMNLIEDGDDANVCWGVSGRDDTLGTIGSQTPYIIRWRPSVVGVQLPPTMTAGDYWLGMCLGRERRSNRVRLQVRGVATAPVVTGYNPPHAVPGGRVRIYGRRFGTRRPGDRIRFGTSLRASGDVRVLSWSDSQIDVRLPDDMRRGTFWLAVYSIDELLSNLEKSLRVGRSEEMTLNTVRLGTTQVIRMDRNDDFYCGLDRRGTGGSGSLDRGQVSVGGVTEYEPGTPPFACWTWSHFSYQGAALIDLSPLVAADRPLPTYAELRFRQEREPTAAPCGTVFVFDANEDWSADLQNERSHPRGTLIGGAGRVDDRLSLPMTEHVHNLINNARGPEAARRRYYGFFLNWDRTQRIPTSEDSRRLNLISSPSGCVGRYRDIALYVRWD